MDTGASVSFINPEYIPEKKQYNCEQVTISTAFNKYQINKKTILPIFKEFNQNGSIDFLLFKFHNYFDGLLGIDALTMLGANINLTTQTLKTKNAVNEIKLKPNLASIPIVIPGNSKILAKLPVDIENGDIYINKIELKPNIILSEGLYHAENWHSTIELTNYSQSEEKLCIEQPLKVEKYIASNHVELNNLNFTKSNIPQDISIRDLLRLDHLNTEERKELIKLCKQYEDIIYKPNEPLTFTSEIKHQIKTTDDVPTYTKSYRYPYVHKEEVRRQIASMLEQGIIRQSYSPWSSPVWVVPKKKDASGQQKWRLVIDYRKVNEKTISDRYPLPNITEILDKLGKCMYFTTLDLASGFHQIEMDPKHIAKTAFTVEDGHYEYVRMPFGLKNAPSTFQRVMDNVLKELIGKKCLVYLDDIIIFSTSLQEHLESIKLVFEKLRQSNFKIQMDKCEFMKKEIAFLGHIITPEGIKPNPMKVDAIKNFPMPKTRKEIKCFVGLISYYRKFIKDLAKLTRPLTKCLKKGAEIIHDNEYIEAFETCKNLLTNDPILQHPDFTKPFILTTDASNFALGAILSQGTIGSDKPICFASRTLSETESRYSTIEKELLAIVWATKYFRPYLFGRKFQIVTDHKPLTWIMNLKEPNSKLVRWRLKLEEFDYEVVYKKGKWNTNADALSRVKINDPYSPNCHELNVNDNTDGTLHSTAHSLEENLNDGIAISEKPLNEFNLQMILEIGEKGSPMVVENIFRNRQRRTIRRPIFNEEEMIDIFKKFLAPNRLTAVYTDDNTFHIVQSVFSKYFSHSKTFRIIRCKDILKDIRIDDDQEKSIREYHEQSNHRGIDECFLHLKREIYFPNMKSIITKTINNCDKCKIHKYDRNPPKIQYEIPEIPQKPLEIVHIDIYTINNNQILTLIDKFSKFAAGFTLKARTSVTVLRALKSYISLYGIPKKIVCDQGPEFTANIFQDFCKQIKTKLHITSFQQTSSNSPVERLHSTLTEIYRIILSTRKEHKLTTEHEEMLNETLITYNNAIHSATKYTPYELFFGRPYIFLKTLDSTGEHEYLTKLNEFLNILYPEIKERVSRVTQAKLDKLNKSREPAEDRDRNEVVFRKEARRNKLTPRFSKHLISKNNKVTVITNRDRKIHKSKLRRRNKK